jgi:putative ABC transport system substrate-binding protein
VTPRLGGIWLACAVGLVLLGTQLNADMLQAGKVYRVGYLTVPSREAAQGGVNAFQAMLRELGWVIGKDVVIEYRFAENNLDRLPGFAAELVRLRVDVIAAGASPAVTAAKNATQTIPIVMMFPGNPVASGLVASLARPGGNITGLASNAGPEIYGKQLQLLKDAFPHMSRVGILMNGATREFHSLGMRQIEITARALRLQRTVVEVRDPREFRDAFAALTRAKSDAIWVPADPLFYQHRARLADLAAQSRLPAIWGLTEHAEAGGLMAYSTNLSDLTRRAAIYVDKILKGAKPTDLPVEQPTKFDLVINLKAARALGVTIPRSLLLQANQVIE